MAVTLVLATAYLHPLPASLCKVGQQIRVTALKEQPVELFHRCVLINLLLHVQ